MPGGSKRKGSGGRDVGKKGAAKIVAALVVHDLPPILMDDQVVDETRDLEVKRKLAAYVILFVRGRQDLNDDQRFVDSGGGEVEGCAGHDEAGNQ